MPRVQEADVPESRVAEVKVGLCDVAVSHIAVEGEPECKENKMSAIRINITLQKSIIIDKEHFKSIYGLSYE